MEYKEFRVIIEDESRIRIIKPSGVSRPGTIQMDRLKEKIIKIFSRWLAEGKITTREELVVLGSYLYNGLFNDDISEVFKDEFDKIQNQRESSTVLRLVLEFESKARKLAEMPWEYIYYPDSEREKGFFIATRSRLILARHVPLDEERFKDLKPDEKPLRILIVVSKPEGLGIVNADPVIETIKELKGRLPHAIATDELPQPTKRSLAQKVNTFRPHVLHFIGHGQYKGEGGSLALVMERDQKTPLWISDVDLADCFADYQPRLIFLHACEGAHTESYEAFRGVALQLVYSKVPAVVAMQYPIENNVANSFADKFYQSLGEGKPIDVAVQDGRLELAMYLNEGQNFSSRAFGSPVIYLQTAEGIIITQVDPEKSQQSSTALDDRVRCPYHYAEHRCTGWVPSVLPSNFKVCMTCGKTLIQCPKGHVMGEELGICSCGYRLESKPVQVGTETVKKEPERLQAPDIEPQRPKPKT
jgi:hypothetical protein